MRGPATSRLSIKDIRKALLGPLPGVAGQEQMAPEPADESESRWHRPAECRKAAVLLLLYPLDKTNHRGAAAAEIHILLTRRAEYPGVHSGQISFPGGQREGQESLRQTALRETEEEVGISPETLEILGRLTPLYVPTSNFCIYPFVAFSSSRPTYRPDPKEVAEIIEMPLALLLDPAIQKKEVWGFEKYGDRVVPFFEVFGHQVWGATAMMLGEFLTLLQAET